MGANETKSQGRSRRARGPGVGISALIAGGLLVGCSTNVGGDPGGTPPDGTGFVDAGGQWEADAGDDPNPSDRDGDQHPDSEDNCPDVANADQLDQDEDLVGDICDCDPADGTNDAILVVDDALITDDQIVAPTTGFDVASWTFNGDGYRQVRLADDAEDASFVQTPPLTDVIVEATVASTEIASFDAQDLRQLFLVGRATSDNDAFDALACGIEVVEGLDPTQKTSVLRLTGAPDAIATDALERVDRALVVENEELQLRMELSGATLSCTVTLDGNDVTTASATDVPIRAGSVGFYTRETKALFKDLRVCTVPGPP